MNITAIKQQVKRNDRYSLYVDAKYSFSLSESELLQKNLRVGQEISQSDLEKLKNDAVLDKAYDRAINLLSIRPRSEWELRTYLKRKEMEPETVDSVIQRLSERKYIDDEAFARRWVESRRLLKPTSKRRLSQELRQKRVEDHIVKRVLEEDETDEREQLTELIRKKRQQSRYQDKMKLMQYLSRQGYSYDDIKSALSEES